LIRGARIIRWVMLVTSVVYSTVVPSWAENRTPTALPTTSELFFNRNRLPEAPSATSDFYKLYLAKEDSRINRLYMQTWRSRPADTGAHWAYENAAPCPTHFVSMALTEDSSRRNFASQVFRLRMQSAITAYTKSPDRPAGVARTGRALETLKNVSMSVGEGASSNQFLIAYDVLADASKVEYRTQYLDSGIYSPHTLSTLMGQQGVAGAGLTITGRMGIRKPTASISYALDGSMVQTTVTQGLSRSLSSSVTSTQPLPGSAVSPSVQLSFGYQF
jgi:hypothetical protein